MCIRDSTYTHTYTHTHTHLSSPHHRYEQQKQAYEAGYSAAFLRRGDLSPSSMQSGAGVSGAGPNLMVGPLPPRHRRRKKDPDMPRRNMYVLSHHLSTYVCGKCKPLHAITNIYAKHVYSCCPTVLMVNLFSHPSPGSCRTVVPLSVSINRDTSTGCFLNSTRCFDHL